MGILTRALVLCLLAAPAAAIAQVAPALRPYTTCKFDDGLAVSSLSPLPPGVAGRTVDTLTGKAQVPLLRGERVMLSYPDTDFFANINARSAAIRARCSVSAPRAGPAASARTRRTG